MIVEVINRTPTRLPLRRIAIITRRIFSQLRSRGVGKKSAYECTIVFVGTAEGQKLNYRFRRKKKAANILSFDYGSSGEIILTLGVVRVEAHRRNESLLDAVTRLLVHGAVHLAGFHHEQSLAFERTILTWERETFERSRLRRAVR